MFDAFREGLRDLGYIEGRNIILEFRLAHGDLSRGPQRAAELVALPVAVLVTEGIPVEAVDPSRHVPIVTPVMQDPVERGFAFSLARSARTSRASPSCMPSSMLSDLNCCTPPSRI